MKAVIWSPSAQQEYDDALAVSPKAHDFQLAVDGALHGIANGTVTHAVVPRTRGRVRECILTGYPYSVIYAETDTEIRIAAFAHHKRRKGYWKNRLPKP